MSPSSRSMWLVTLFLAAGCAHDPCCCRDNLGQRIQPPPGFDEFLVIDTPSPPKDGKKEDKKKPETEETLPPPKEGARSDKTESEPSTFAALRQAGFEVPDRGHEEGPPVGKTLSLPEAIELAFRLQPRLRVFLEGIEQARGGEQVAFAPFLPTLAGAYSVGAFDLNTGGSIPNTFTFLPIGGAIPIDLEIRSRYELAELRLQWLICDFGRRLG